MAKVRLNYKGCAETDKGWVIGHELDGWRRTKRQLRDKGSGSRDRLRREVTLIVREHKVKGYTRKTSR